MCTNPLPDFTTQAKWKWNYREGPSIYFQGFWVLNCFLIDGQFQLALGSRRSLGFALSVTTTATNLLRSCSPCMAKLPKAFPSLWGSDSIVLFAVPDSIFLFIFSRLSSCSCFSNRTLVVLHEVESAFPHAKVICSQRDLGSETRRIMAKHSFKTFRCSRFFSFSILVSSSAQSASSGDKNECSGAHKFPH